MDFMNHPDPFTCDLMAAYYDTCLLLSKLDKHILADRYRITEDDPIVNTRWQMAYWIERYDKGRECSYLKYIQLSNAARDVLEGEVSE